MPLLQSINNIRLGALQSALSAASRATGKLLRGPVQPQHLLLGGRGEIEALFYLRRRGFVIVAQRWKSPMAPGDLDLVAWDADCLCFVEVKTRTTRDAMFTAEGAVGEQKRKALRRLAKLYLRRIARPPKERRFDVVAVYVEPGKPAAFEHFPSAFAWNAN